MSINSLATRRAFLAGTSAGVGFCALAHLLHRDGLLAADGPRKPGENLPASLAPRQTHHAPKAKAMISLFMHGGPSHVDLFDPKPELTKNSGKEYAGNVQYSFVNRASKKLFGSPWKFAKHGKGGTEVSELLPHTAGVVDDIAVLNSMHTGANGHEVSIRYFHGGIAGITGRPTMGSWIVYGLGTESQNLPAYVVLSDPAGPPVDAAHNKAVSIASTLHGISPAGRIAGSGRSKGSHAYATPPALTAHGAWPPMPPMARMSPMPPMPPMSPMPPMPPMAPMPPAPPLFEYELPENALT